MELQKIDVICQIVTPILSMTTVYLLTRKDEIKNYGYLVGLCSQPFWLFTTAYHGQPGLFIAACFFTIRWSIGIKNHLIPNLTRRMVEP